MFSPALILVLPERSELSLKALRNTLCNWGDTPFMSSFTFLIKFSVFCKSFSFISEDIFSPKILIIGPINYIIYLFKLALGI